VSVIHRRAGKDKTCLNVMIKEMFKRVGTYWYIMPAFTEVKRTIWDGIDGDGFAFMGHFPEELRASTNKADMQIKAINGSVLQLLGSDNYNSMRGQNPIGVVFSEYSQQNPMAWETVISPILLENGGWAIFNYCVAPGTIVLTENGMKRIGSICPDAKEGFTALDMNIYGLGGLHNAEQFYKAKQRNVVTITTGSGYKLTSTPNHPTWTGNEWRKAEEWVVGDRMPIQRGQMQWGDDIPSKLTQCNRRPDLKITADKKLCYIMGLWLAEGSMRDDGAITITTKYDKKLHKRLINFGFKKYDEFHYIYCSKQMVEFFKWFGLKQGAHNKDIPEMLLGMPESHVSAFLRGYFDGDGCASKRGGVSCASVSEKLMEDIQVLLLNYGIVSQKRTMDVRPTKKVKVHSTVFVLEIVGYSAWIYYQRIGFYLSRKQKRAKHLRESNRDWYGDCYQWTSDEVRDEVAVGINMPDIKRHNFVTYRKLREIALKKSNIVVSNVIHDCYYYDKIVSIEHGISDVCDFVIPDTHSFFSNGFISHNTPFGHNHGYQLYNMAKSNPLWWCTKQTVKDTFAMGGTISKEMIQREREEGKSEETINQEYYCDFDSAVHGAIFANELRNARANDRITKVAPDCNSVVNTFWDIGVNDLTTIWLVQEIGTELHALGVYSASGEGLVHYVNELNTWRVQNGVTFGVHVLPHDGANRRMLNNTAESLAVSLSEFGFEVEIVNRPIDKTIATEASRQLFPRLWFDEKGCDVGISALGMYRRRWNEEMKVFSKTAVHDWASHYADGFQTMALYYKMESMELAGPPILTGRMGSQSFSGQSEGGWMGA